MEYYVSAYINITNMASPTTDSIREKCRNVISSSLCRLSVGNDEFDLQFSSFRFNRMDDDDECISIDDANRERANTPIAYICRGLGDERTDDQVLFGKIVAWRTSDLDLSDLVPNLEPEICIFAFEDYTFHDSPRFFEIYVRGDYLQSPEGRKFGEEVLRATLRGEVLL